MNNKILTRIISLVMVASVVLAVGGCGKKGSSADDANSNAEAANGTTKKSVTEVIDGKGSPVQPDIDEEKSAAVIKYTKVDANGKKEDATTVVNINSPVINDLTMSSKLNELIKTDDQKKDFIDSVVSDTSGDKKKAEEIISKADEWVEFGYTAYIANTSSQRLITSFIEIGGKNDNIVMKKSLDCEYSIKSGSGIAVYISGLVNVEKYPDEEAIFKELNNMDIKLVYTLADDSVTDIDDWNSVTKKTMTLKFG